MTLSTIAQTNWIRVPLGNIQGNPGGGINPPFQACWVGFDVHYSSLADITSFNVVSHILTNLNEHRAYLTADESKIRFNGTLVDQIDAKIALIQRIVSSQNLSVQLDFTNNPGTPDITITS